MKLLLIIICSGVLLGCGSSRKYITVIDPVMKLRNRIDAILSDSLFTHSRASIKVVSIDNGKVIYDRGSKYLMHPASNLKMLTSAAALHILDTNYQFKTAVFADGISPDSSVARNIYLKGYGDPDLTTSDLDSLAISVRQKGITTITNDIIVDDSYFDDNHWGAGWIWDDESHPDAPYINALSINKNCIRATLLTDSNTSFIYLEPMTDFVEIINNAKITFDSIRIPAKLKCEYLDNPNTIIAEGDLYCYDQISRKIALRQPAYYAGTLFKESLQRAGITVFGGVLNGVVPNGLHDISCKYQPIEKLIINMNKVSDNLSAENLLKVIGATTSGIPGTAKTGIFALKLYLSTLGIDTTMMSIVDGSGVSRYNLLSADQLVQFLIAIYKQPRIFSTFYNSLPLAGVDGTLADRMLLYPTAYNVRAKTGTLNGVSCLSGYVQTRDSEMLAFSMLIQHFVAPANYYRNAQDRILALLADFSRSTIAHRNVAK